MGTWEYEGEGWTAGEGEDNGKDKGEGEGEGDGEARKLASPGSHRQLTSRRLPSSKRPEPAHEQIEHGALSGSDARINGSDARINGSDARINGSDGHLEPPYAC